MVRSQRISLKQSEPVKNLDRRGDTRLMECDGFRFVAKKISRYARPVYERLSEEKIPGVAGIYEITEDGDDIFVLEEYIEGVCLKDMEEMDAADMYPVVRGLCKTVTALGKLNPPIIHRDIKPSNIILGDDGDVYLVDFGAAREFEKGLSEDTVNMGTEGYAAPEQYGFSQSDSRTDIYGIGVTISVMLTGHLPKEKMPEGPMGDLVAKCTAIDPAARYKSPSDIEKDYIRVLRGRKIKGQQTWTKYLPVGFRSGNIFAMLISTAVHYICLGVLFSSNFEGTDSPWGTTTVRGDVAIHIILLIWFLGTVAFVGDWLSVRHKLAKSQKPAIHILQSLAYIIAFTFVCFYLTYFASSL